MDKEEKIKSLEHELNYIKDSKIKELTQKIIENAPDYFFAVAASSTGKYHPDYALGEGGLLRHTKAAVRIAIELFRMGCFNYTDLEEDIILASLIVHDTEKHGQNGSKYTVTEHPLIAAEEIKKINFSENIVDGDIANKIIGNVSSHMGKWNYDYKTKRVVLPSPSTKMQNFTHLCDYIASRKCLEFDFDVDVIRE